MNLNLTGINMDGYLIALTIVYSLGFFVTFLQHFYLYKKFDRINLLQWIGFGIIISIFWPIVMVSILVFNLLTLVVK